MEVGRGRAQRHDLRQRRGDLVTLGLELEHAAGPCRAGQLAGLEGLLPSGNPPVDVVELALELPAVLRSALPEHARLLDHVAEDQLAAVLREHLLGDVFEQLLLEPLRRQPMSGTRLLARAARRPAVVVPVRPARRVQFAGGVELVARSALAAGDEPGEQQWAR
ncbi:MAG: hypothetical protein U0263_32665 [Polyangiaceae bacterium]